MRWPSEYRTVSLQKIYGILTDTSSGRGQIRRMKTHLLSILVLAAQFAWGAVATVAHPGSGIVVAVHRGEVYVLEYTNANGSAKEGWRPRVRKLRRDGKVTTLLTVAAEK